MADTVTSLVSEDVTLHEEETSEIDYDTISINCKEDDDDDDDEEDDLIQIVIGKEACIYEKRKEDSLDLETIAKVREIKLKMQNNLQENENKLAYLVNQGKDVSDFIIGPSVLDEITLTEYKKISPIWVHSNKGGDQQNALTCSGISSSAKVDAWLSNMNEKLKHMIEMVSVTNNAKKCRVAFVVFTTTTKMYKNSFISGPQGSSVTEFVYNETDKVIEEIVNYATMVPVHPDMHKTSRVYGNYSAILDHADCIVVADHGLFVTCNAYPWFDMFRTHKNKMRLYTTSIGAKTNFDCPDADIHVQTKCIHCRTNHILMYTLPFFDLDYTMISSNKKSDDNNSFYVQRVNGTRRKHKMSLSFQQQQQQHQQQYQQQNHQHPPRYFARAHPYYNNNNSYNRPGNVTAPSNRFNRNGPVSYSSYCDNHY